MNQIGQLTDKDEDDSYTKVCAFLLIRAYLFTFDHLLPLTVSKICARAHTHTGLVLQNDVHLYSLKNYPIQKNLFRTLFGIYFLPKRCTLLAHVQRHLSFISQTALANWLCVFVQLHRKYLNVRVCPLIIFAPSSVQFPASGITPQAVPSSTYLGWFQDAFMRVILQRVEVYN